MAILDIRYIRYPYVCILIRAIYTMYFPVSWEPEPSLKNLWIIPVGPKEGTGKLGIGKNIGYPPELGKTIGKP
jgi:hypothetical protein